jgi:hypothetical protein
VVKIGPGVEGFSVGDDVFAMAADAYAVVPSICPKDVDQRESKLNNGGSDGTRTRGLLRDRQGF